jgi:hypothetical protein
MVLPISQKRDETAVKSSIFPQTMIESVPFIAPISPPETGASRLQTHFSFASL